MSGEYFHGTLVKCIDNHGAEDYLELNKAYTVLKSDDRYLYLDFRYTGGWFKWRFAFAGDEDGI